MNSIALRPSLARRLSVAGREKLAAIASAEGASPAIVDIRRSLATFLASSPSSFCDLAVDFEEAVGGLDIGPLRLGIIRTLREQPAADGDGVLGSGLVSMAVPAGVDEWNGAPLYLFLDDRGRLVADQDLETVRVVADSWPIYIERRLLELSRRGARGAYLARSTSALGAAAAAALGATRVDAASDSIASCWNDDAACSALVLEFCPEVAAAATLTEVRVSEKAALVSVLRALHHGNPTAPLSTNGPDLGIDWARRASAWDEVPAGAIVVLVAPFDPTTTGHVGRLLVFERDGDFLFRVVVCPAFEIAEQEKKPS